MIIPKPRIECGKGWECLYGPIIHLCTIYKATVFQIKEKHGSLKVYTDDIPNWLLDFINKCETASKHICEQCGQAVNQTSYSWYAKLHDQTNYRLLITKCKKCRKDRIINDEHFNICKITTH